MTIAELMKMLQEGIKDRRFDTSDVVVLGFYQRHGDSLYVAAEDQLRPATFERDGEEFEAVVLGASEADDVAITDIE